MLPLILLVVARPFGGMARAGVAAVVDGVIRSI
jgi:hypothetical protein